MEHHGDVAFGGGHGGDVVVIKCHGAFGGQFQTGQHAQGGGFAAAGRAHEDEEFAVVDVQVDVLDRITCGTGIAQADV